MERPDFELEDLMFEDDIGENITVSGLADIFVDDDEKPSRRKKKAEKGEKRRRKEGEEREVDAVLSAQDTPDHHENAMRDNFRALDEAERRQHAPLQDDKPGAISREMPSCEASGADSFEEPAYEAPSYDAAGYETAPYEAQSYEAAPYEATKRIPGKVIKRISRDKVDILINRKVDAIMERMLKQGDIQIGPPAQNRVSGATMPLHAAAAGPENYCLVDTATKQVIAIKGILRIGRDPSFADFIPAGNATISSQHAQITEKCGVLLIRDMGSRNGTFINDERIVQGHNIEINEGDLVKFSNAEYRLETL